MSERDTFVEQVGGAHYQSAYQHWDWTSDLSLGYLEGSATKYISRWRGPKGEGIKDLRKGLSFVHKLIKVNAGPMMRIPACPLEKVAAETSRFAAANGLNHAEHMACLNIAAWTTPHNLKAAQALVEGLIADAEAAPQRAEENNHASEG